MQLYTHKNGAKCRPQEWRFPQVTHRNRGWLNRPVTEVEIHEAVKQMGPYKAPRPGGFPPCIFQRYWHIMGPVVVEAVQGMFTLGKLLPNMNEALIYLIPKVTQPKTLAQLQPISLCNVITKIVSKILANKLKPVMASLTSPMQSSSIPGRTTIDNIVVAQEALHSLKKKKGRRGALILKVDLEKEYDRLDWGF